MSVTNTQKQAVSYRYSGFLLSVDSLPPLFLRFQFNPEKFKDNTNAEFAFSTSPGSRFQFPIYMGGTPRIVTFQLKFDQDYPIACELGKIKNDEDIGSGRGAGTVIKKAIRMRLVQQVLEQFKLPKLGLANNTFASISGKFFKGSAVSDPSPPTIILGMAIDKYVLGFLSKAEIEVEKQNRYMMPTRFRVNCEFIVTPDRIFTFTEDAIRFVGSTTESIKQIASIF